MFRHFALALPLLLATCGPTLAPAHPLEFAWHRTCPPDDGSGDKPDPNANPNNYVLDYSGASWFCDKERQHPLCSGAPGHALPLAKLTKLDKKLRAMFQYRSDTQLYPKIANDVWAGYTVCGDCEDYALTLASMLADAGEGGKFMWLSLLTVDPSGAGHATLLVQTSDSGLMEVSVDWPEAPYPYAFDKRREARLPMDGSFTIIPEPGYGLNEKKVYVDRLPKK